MSTSALEQLEQLKKRLDGLTARRTAAQVKLESARQQYQEAVSEAQANYGTSNLDELRAILVKEEERNTAALADFLRGLNDFEDFLGRIEKALENPEVMAAMVSAMEPVATPAAAPLESIAPAAAIPAVQEEDI